MRILGQCTIATSTCMRLHLAACLVMLAGCASTSVDQVWRDGRRAATSLGKTLVIAVAPSSEVAVALENEWVRQLQGRGVDAHSLNTVLPGERQPDKQRVIQVVKANAFHTVLVSRIVERKKVEREVSVSGSPMSGAPGYTSSWSDIYGTSRSFASSGTYTVENEVAVVETNLYDAGSEKLFWSARSDTFLEGSAGELIHGFVQAMIKEMSKSKLF